MSILHLAIAVIVEIHVSEQIGLVDCASSPVDSKVGGTTPPLVALIIITDVDAVVDLVPCGWWAANLKEVAYPAMVIALFEGATCIVCVVCSCWICVSAGAQAHEEDCGDVHIAA